MSTPTGPIHTDEIASPGYVWFACTVYGLPDNTQGQIGYHCVYRPLAVHLGGVPMYTGNEHGTDTMRADLRAYYGARGRLQSEQRARQQEEAHAVMQYSLRHRSAAPTHRQIPGLTIPCPHCGTYCAGDCQAD